MNIKENIFYIVRNHVKKYLTGNLGEIIEEENKILCFVDPDKIKKSCYNKTIMCQGLKEEDKVLAKAYNLNKSICYVIQSIVFDKRTQIIGNNCDIYINDCEFQKETIISVTGKCKIEATDFEPLCILKIEADNLLLQDLSIKNEHWYASELAIDIKAKDKLQIDGSRIGNVNRRININLKSDNDLTINSSLIYGDTLKIDANNLEYTGNTIINNEKYGNNLKRVLEKEN